MINHVNVEKENKNELKTWLYQSISATEAFWTVRQACVKIFLWKFLANKILPQNIWKMFQINRIFFTNHVYDMNTQEHTKTLPRTYKHIVQESLSSKYEHHVTLFVLSVGKLTTLKRKLWTMFEVSVDYNITSTSSCGHVHLVSASILSEMHRLLFRWYFNTKIQFR